MQSVLERISGYQLRELPWLRNAHPVRAGDGQRVRPRSFLMARVFATFIVHENATYRVRWTPR